MYILDELLKICRFLKQPLPKTTNIQYSNHLGWQSTHFGCGFSHVCLRFSGIIVITRQIFWDCFCIAALVAENKHTKTISNNLPITNLFLNLIYYWSLYCHAISTRKFNQNFKKLAKNHVLNWICGCLTYLALRLLLTKSMAGIKVSHESRTFLALYATLKLVFVFVVTWRAIFAHVF